MNGIQSKKAVGNWQMTITRTCESKSCLKQGFTPRVGDFWRFVEIFGDFDGVGEVPPRSGDLVIG